jgi:ABC-type antimicrobial peptide transport system permease subunit
MRKEKNVFFNPASYALSHMRHSLFRTITTVTTLSITIAFLLLTSSLMFGLIAEIRGGDDKSTYLRDVPGSIDMFEEYQIGSELSDSAKTSLINWLVLTSTLVFMVAFFIMYNTMAIAAQERKREIGLLRSVGYSTKDVMKIFITEGAFMGFISWLIALFFGTPFIINLAAYLIERGDEGFFFVSPLIPIPLVIISAAVSMGICILSTYMATLRYIRKPPVEMMRGVN